MIKSHDTFKNNKYNETIVDIYIICYIGIAPYETHISRALPQYLERQRI